MGRYETTRLEGIPKMATNLQYLEPHATEAEIAVLGSILVNPGCYGSVSHILTTEDFFIERHGWIWSTIDDLIERGIGPDPVTVSIELDKHGHLAEAGSTSYLLSLINQTPSSLNVEGFARMVAEFSYRRRLIRFSEMVAGLAHRDTTSLVDIHDKISHALTDLGGKAINKHRSAREAFGDFSEAFAVRVQDAIDGTPQIGLDVGIPEWNTVLDGDFRPGSYIGLMGPTKIGKTWAMMQMALASARRVPVIYFSLENLEESLLNRFIAIHAGVPLTCVKTGLYKGAPMPPEMLEKVYRAADELALLPIEFVTHLNSAKEIAHHIKSATIRHGTVGMAFVDTLNQLADASSDGQYENLVRASGRLLQTMRGTGWGIVTAIQMRIELRVGMSAQAAKDAGYPGIHSVEGCRKIAQDLSKLIGIYRSDYVAEKTNNPSFTDPQCPSGQALFVDVASRDSEGMTDKLVLWNRSIPRFETALLPSRTIEAPAVQQSFVGASHPDNGNGDLR